MLQQSLPIVTSPPDFRYTPSNGVILTAPIGLCYRMKVNNDGRFISG